MNIDTCKVVLVGECGVGKTSIIRQFLDKKMDMKQPPTTGASYSTTTVAIHNRKVKLELWDTVGQERFRSLTRLYYKDASAAIIVSDITKSKSFREAQSYWALQIADFCPENTIMALALNKADLYEIEQVNELEVEEYAKGMGALYQRTSALSSEGVEALFKKIARQFIKNDFNTTKRSIDYYDGCSTKISSRQSITNVSQAHNKCC